MSSQYTLLLASKDAAAGANYQLNLTAGQILAGNVGITSSNGAYFGFSGNAMSVQTLTGGTTGATLVLEASGDVAGMLTVIPAVSVATELTLKDENGKEVGSYTLAAGKSDGSFAWQLPA